MAADDVAVVDVDDYNRQQRFQEIHQARQRVTEYLAGIDGALKEMGNRKAGKHPAYVGETLAFRVSLYVGELLPLLRQRGGDDPFFSEQFPQIYDVDDLEEYALRSGIVTSDNAQPWGTIRYQMRIFHLANRAYAQLGMEPDLDDADAQTKIDDDLLEEVNQWRQNNA